MRAELATNRRITDPDEDDETLFAKLLCAVNIEFAEALNRAVTPS